MIPSPPRAVHRPSSSARVIRRLLLWFVAAHAIAGCSRPERRPLASDDLVGDGVCLQCHDEMESYLSTAHSNTSAPATAASIHGSFAEGENVLATANPYLHYRLEATDSGFRQTAVQTAGGDTTRISEKFDLVVGSGRKGQTYLFWRGAHLFQLPVSYWRGIGWANSPGYTDSIADFRRPVNPRCLECHATLADAQPTLAASNQYDTTSLVLGISCESCHGGGRAHVEVERAPASWLRASGIINPADLSRERRVEGCALCHGGVGEPVRPPFSYVPGEPLSGYLHQPEPSPDAAVDVHGNQVALLARSPCFVGSQMTCSTCHDVHKPQREAADFSSVCTSCHTPADELAADHGATMPGNCVDCHMPELPTNVIVANDAGEVLRPTVRTHWIRVYEELTRVGARGEGAPLASSRAVPTPGPR